MNNESEMLIMNHTNRFSVFYPQASFLAVLKNYLTIDKILRSKNEISVCVRSSIIYKFLCGECNDFYLGCRQHRFNCITLGVKPLVKLTGYYVAMVLPSTDAQALFSR